MRASEGLSGYVYPRVNSLYWRCISSPIPTTTTGMKVIHTQTAIHRHIGAFVLKFRRQLAVAAKEKA